MSAADRHQDAAELALRVLEPEAQHTAEQELDEAARGEVARWQTRLGRLASALPAEVPPLALFDRVLERIRAAAAPESGTLTVRAGEGEWQPMGPPGITFKTLWQDRRTGRRGMLVRVEPGAVHPAHSHDQDEECLVLEGKLRFGDLELSSGDFHLARKGHRHPPGVTTTGCLLYISGSL